MTRTIRVPQPHSRGKYREAYLEGYDRGRGIASWIDQPDLGSKIDKSVDWVGYGDVVTSENQQDYHATLAFAAESNDRQFSPFEHQANEINSDEDANDLWAAFDDGIAAGIYANLKTRYSKRAA